MKRSCPLFGQTLVGRKNSNILLPTVYSAGPIRDDSSFYFEDYIINLFWYGFLEHKREFIGYFKNCLWWFNNLALSSGLSNMNPRIWPKVTWLPKEEATLKVYFFSSWWCTKRNLNKKAVLQNLNSLLCTDMTRKIHFKLGFSLT